MKKETKQLESDKYVCYQLRDGVWIEIDMKDLGTKPGKFVLILKEHLHIAKAALHDPKIDIQESFANNRRVMKGENFFNDYRESHTYAI